MKNSKLCAFVLGVAILALPGVGFAAESTPVPPGLTLCEYYELPAGVRVSVVSELSEVYAGAEIVFSAEITNASTEVLTDAQAYLKIVSLDGSAPRVVALVAAQVPLPLRPGESATLPIRWDSSEWLSKGSYVAEVVVFAQGRAAVAGSLDATSTGSPYYFSVVREGDETIGFFSNTIRVNGVPVQGFGGVYAVPESGAFTLDVPLENKTTVPVKSDMTWTVYKGPMLSTALAPSTAPLKAHPRSEGFVTLHIDDETHPEYVIIGTGDVRGAPVSAVFIVRRMGYQHARLVSGGIGRSLVDDSRAAYACVESPAAYTDHVRLVLKAKRQWLGLAWSFATKTYEGPVPQGKAFALAEPVAEGVSGYVVAELYQGEDLVDELTVPYGADTKQGWLGVAVMLLCVLMLSVLAWWYVRRRT